MKRLALILFLCSSLVWAKGDPFRVKNRTDEGKITQSAVNSGQNMAAKNTMDITDKGNGYFSIHLQQAPMLMTLQELATKYQINLVVDDELEGTLSLRLDHTNMTQLLQVIAKIKQLALLKENDVYYLSKMDLTAPEGKSEFSLSALTDIGKISLVDETDLKTITIKLHFAKASEVMKSLTTGSGSLLSAEGSIGFDDRSNKLIIKDHPTSLNGLRKVIKELDKPIEQIAIEARIVTINDESLQEMGVRWGLLEPTENAHKIGASLGGKESLAQQLNVNFANVNMPSGSVALQVAKMSGRLLDLELTALERENNVKIIASPKLLTTNKKAASIKQGAEIPYISVNEKSGSQSVEFREAVLGLEVTPHISQDQSILLDLVVSQNSPGPLVSSGEGSVITIDKQEINTQVFAKDGETIVLGGVFQDSISKGIDKVPLLGDIPLLKSLFSKEIEKHQKRELVIFVTPHIIKQGQSLAEFEKAREKDRKLLNPKGKLIQ